MGEPITPEDTCWLHFGAQAGYPERGGSPGLVFLQILTAVLKSFDVEWALPSRCCDLSSFGPQKDLFLSTCVT